MKAPAPRARLLDALVRALVSVPPSAAPPAPVRTARGPAIPAVEAAAPGRPPETADLSAPRASRAPTRAAAVSSRLNDLLADRASLQAAFVLGELLAPPVALRNRSAGVDTGGRPDAL